MLPIKGHLLALLGFPHSTSLHPGGHTEGLLGYRGPYVVWQAAISCYGTVLAGSATALISRQSEHEDEKSDRSVGIQAWCQLLKWVWALIPWLEDHSSLDYTTCHRWGAHGVQFFTECSRTGPSHKAQPLGRDCCYAGCDSCQKKSAPAWATIPARNPCFCMGSPQATAQISALIPSCVLQQDSLLHHTAHYNRKITAPSPEVPLSPFPWPLCLQGCFSHTFSLSAAVQQSLPFLKYPLNQHHSLAWLWPAEQQSALAGIPIK